MRTDVKLGVFFSMAIVLVLGGYFVYPRGGGEAIPMTGDVKPGGGKSASTRFADNSKKANKRGTPVVASKSIPAIRKYKKNKPPVQTRRSNPPRLANKTPVKRRLPVSGASLASDSPVASKNGAIKRKPPSFAASRRPVHAPRKIARNNPAVKMAKKRGAAQRVPGNLTEKPGTPTPPGLLAATRKKPVAKDEPAVDLHHVQPGDTFATLAQAYYGSSRYVEFLMKANPNVDPARMRVGTTIRIPALSGKKNTVASSVAKQTQKPVARSSATNRYTVRSGDSFYRIAEQQLSDATRWKELFELNKKVVGQDPSRLKVGQILTLPAK